MTSNEHFIQRMQDNWVPRTVVEAAKLLAEYLQRTADENEEIRPLSRAKHPAWEYFERVDRYDAVCLLCSATVRSACSTNLSRHIQKHHPSTALEMRKAWLAGRRGGGSPTAAPAAIAATSAATDCASEMNCEGGDPACPLLVNPYSSAMMTNSIGQPLLTPTLALTDLTSTWIPYPDIRTIDAAPSYESDLPLGYPDLSAQKFDHIKYEYPEIRTDKPFEEQPRLYHKEEIKVEEEGEKNDEKLGGAGGGDSTPVKRGRPTENPCWNYFIRLDDQNVRCRLCSKVVKSACATNMTKHLERHHQNDYQQLIVQIRQYRSAKGHIMSNETSQQCLLPTQYVKQEPYPDIYAPHTTENELSAFSYERTDAALWQRQQWSQWPTQMDNGSLIDTRTNGVILHGSTQSWPTTSTGGGPVPTEKPYMKRNRKTEHPVWEYFKRTSDGNAQCAICAGVVKSPCSSNFMRHLMRHHSAEYNNVYVKWVQKRGPAK